MNVLRLLVFDFHSSNTKTTYWHPTFSVHWHRKKKKKGGSEGSLDLFTQPTLRKLMVFSADKLAPLSSERNSRVHGGWEGKVIFIKTKV